MERTKNMPPGPETEISLSSLTPEEVRDRLHMSFLPDEDEMPFFDHVIKQRDQEERQEEIRIKALKEREKHRPSSDILRKQREGQMAERFGLPAEPRDGYKYEWIHSQQLGEIPVEWPDTQEKAEKHIKVILGRIELAQASPTQQMQVDFQSAQSVLEVLEVREEQEGLSPEQIKKQQKWATKMREEMKARIQLHNVFLEYEGVGGIDKVKQAWLNVDAGWMNVLFGLEESLGIPKKDPKTGALIQGKEETFNPFTEALQYYENHGHEFARHNSRELRGVFAKKAQEHLVNYIARRKLGISEDTLRKDFTQEQEAKYADLLANTKTEDYKWASNMAERMFRSTGRAIMYDYLVVNKDSKDSAKPERMVTLDYVPIGDEKVEWAGGRDGTDYPLSKVYRLRENLKSSSEAKLMRANISLLDGVDLYGGDFWTRTINKESIKGNPERLKYFKISQKDFDVKVKKTAEDIKRDEDKSSEEALKEANDRLLSRFKIISEPDFSTITDPIERQRALEYYLADLYSDRDSDDNEGEQVGRINFRDMFIRLDDEGKVIEGVDFKTMGDTPFSLWCSRMLGGPEKMQEKIGGSPDSFLQNPTFQSLGKLIDAFDYSKGNAWKVKKQLLINFIKYARGTRVDTGKRRLSENEIIQGVNQLTGLTDENAPQFVQLPERIEILKNYFGIKVSDSDIKGIKEQAKKEAGKQFDALVKQEKAEAEKHGRTPRVWTKEEKDKEIEDLTKQITNRDINDKLSKKIEKRIGRKFGLAFAGWFLLGVVKEALKQGFNLGK